MIQFAWLSLAPTRPGRAGCLLRWDELESRAQGLDAADPLAGFRGDVKAGPTASRG